MGTPAGAERCGADWVHSAHSWPEGDGEVHRCDGGSDQVDERDAEVAVQDELCAS
jgi:hypothetical protein